MQENALPVPKSDNWKHVDSIIAYLASDGAIKLTHTESEILTRITFADELIREGRYLRGEVRNLIMQRFGVSRETAQRDIADAEFIYASSVPLNKQYRIGVRIDKVEQFIREAQEKDDYELVAKFETILAKYLEMYPDVKQSKRPQVLVFNMPESITEETIDLTKAVEIGKKEIGHD